MTLKLVTAVDRTARSFDVDGHSERPMPFLAQLDEELVLVTAGAGRLYTAPYPAPASQAWRVERGANGTIAAPHAAETDVVPVVTQVQTSGPASPPVASEPVIPSAALVDPASGTAIADLRDSLIAAGLMDARLATTLAFDDEPATADTGATMDPVTVQVLDQSGALLETDDTTDVTVALAVPGEATLGGTLTQTAVAGVATFDDLEVDTADTYTLTAAATALAGDESAEFEITAP